MALYRKGLYHVLEDHCDTNWKLDIFSRYRPDLQTPQKAENFSIVRPCARFNVPIQVHKTKTTIGS